MHAQYGWLLFLLSDGAPEWQAETLGRLSSALAVACPLTGLVGYAFALGRFTENIDCKGASGIITVLLDSLPKRRKRQALSSTSS